MFQVSSSVSGPKSGSGLFYAYLCCSVNNDRYYLTFADQSISEKWFEEVKKKYGVYRASSQFFSFRETPWPLVRERQFENQFGHSMFHSVMPSYGDRGSHFIIPPNAGA